MIPPPHVHTSIQVLAADSHWYEPLCPLVPREEGGAWIQRLRGQTRLLGHPVRCHLSYCSGIRNNLHQESSMG